MTYFALFPEELKARDLKLAIVFNYENFKFEVWLAARNRKVQKRYYELLLKSGYKKHPLIEPAVGIDAIVTAILKGDPSFEDESILTAEIIEGVTAFEKDIVTFLNKVDARKSK
ncbi:MAG: hypothetical protein GX654_13155 [Desulfatiglans sp.]|jgi:hypothetical protein|nr:hypothetical protein [Desulfatiglans sp.]